MAQTYRTWGQIPKTHIKTGQSYTQACNPDTVSMDTGELLELMAASLALGSVRYSVSSKSYRE